MSDTIITETVTDSTEETGTENSTNTIATVAVGALVGVAATVAVRYVVKKFRAAKEEQVHVIHSMDNETETPES